MEHPVFERDPSEKSEAERREVPPLLKLVLSWGRFSSSSLPMRAAKC